MTKRGVWLRDQVHRSHISWLISTILDKVSLVSIELVHWAIGRGNLSLDTTANRLHATREARITSLSGDVLHVDLLADWSALFHSLSHLKKLLIVKVTLGFDHVQLFQGLMTHLLFLIIEIFLDQNFLASRRLSVHSGRCWLSSSQLLWRNLASIRVKVLMELLSGLRRVLLSSISTISCNFPPLKLPFTIEFVSELVKLLLVLSFHFIGLVAALFPDTTNLSA